MCRDVAENRAGVDELQEILETARKNLGDIRAGFDMMLSGQSQKVQKACRDIVPEINRAFDEYERVMKDVGSYFHSFDKGSLKASASRVSEASANLDRLLFEFRQAGLIALGPSGVPGLNLLLNTVQRIQNGEQLQEKLMEQAEREGIYSQQVVQELKAAGRNPENMAKAEAWQTVSDAADLLVAYVQSGDYKSFEDAQILLNDAVIRFEELPGAVDQEALSKSPTASPVANIVINAFLGLRDGVIPPEFAAEALGRLWNDMETIKFRFNAITRNPADSSLVEEEAEIVADVIAAMEEALNEYDACLDNGSYEPLDEINEKLTAMIEQLEESMGIFQELADKENKTPCPKCGHYNYTINKFCEKCSFKLPAFSGEQAAGLDVSDSGQARAGEKQGPVMTENVQRLFECANSVIAGKVSLDEFDREVSMMEELLAAAYNSAGPLPHTNTEKYKQADKDKIAKFDSVLKEASDVYVHGLEDFEVGLSFFRQYIEGGSSESISTGMQLIWQGLGKLQDVYKATEPFVRQ